MRQKLFLLTFLIWVTITQAQNPNATYTVQHIPYNLQTIPAQSSALYIDDSYSTEINIGFSFSFFDIAYDQLLVGDNGIVSFDLTKAGQYCTWQINDTDVIPDSSFPEKNAICGVYQDTYIPAGGTINYAEIGTAPFRKFVAFYNDVSLYSCNNLKTTSQIILFETYHFIDVQVEDRTPCDTWNNGNGVLGIIDETGDNGYTPPNRNTGNWSVTDEAWRFRPETTFPDYQYILCDANLDGVESFDLDQIIAYYTNQQFSSVDLFPTYDDALNFTNSISGLYNNTSNAQSIYVVLDNGTTREIRRIILAAIDCNADYDLDGVPTVNEDLNGNGNYGDDDTDGDGIPDFLDDDDDGDMVLTQFEAPLLDSDVDGTPNYLDLDDDGDGIWTIYEDIALPNTYPQDYNPTNDDTDGDGIPNYLDIDDDGDGILTINEHPDDNANGNPEDALDTDGDGIPDYIDGERPYSDHDNDGISDESDLDDDNDGIPDTIECNGMNPLTDADNDGVPVYLDDNDNDNSIGNDNYIVEAAFDIDNDGTPNHFDLDSDGDGLFDLVESGSTGWTDVNMDGMIDDNVGNNGLADILESSTDSGIIAYIYQDTDGDNVYDFLDIDDDNDGILTINEHPDPNGNHYPNDAWDTNNNGIPDYLDVSTGSSPVLAADALKIYPVPAKNVLHIDFNIAIRKAGLKLYTQDGRMIEQQSLNKSKNLINLPKTQGVYYLKIITDKGNMFKSIIKK